MAHSKNDIKEILDSVKKIGILKTSKLFNVSTASIYRWVNEKSIPDKENISKKIAPETSNCRKLLFRRVHIKNDSLICYIYNIKDLRNRMEFNSISYNSNYQTPVTFLTYILSIYFKETKINSFQILLKGFKRLKNYEKFQEIFRDFKVEFLRTDDFFSIDSYNNKQISIIADKNSLIEQITIEQLFYNINLGDNKHLNLALHFPVLLDEFTNANIIKYIETLNASAISLILEKLFHKTDILLKEADFNQAEKNLEVIQVVLQYFSKDVRLL